MTRVAAALVVLLALPASAQTPPVPAPPAPAPAPERPRRQAPPAPPPIPEGYEALAERVRDETDPLILFLLRSTEAFDVAVEEGAYARADSIATLVEARVHQPGREVVWPSHEDRYALDYLRGDPTLAARLAERGRVLREVAQALERRAGLVQLVLGDPPAHATVETPVRPSVGAALYDTLDANWREADGEEATFLDLAARAWMLGPPPVGPRWQPSALRRVLNEDATAFLERYPESPWADYVRAAVRYVYVAGPSQVGSIAFGASSPAGPLAERTDGAPFAIDLAYELRGRLWHAGVGLEVGYVDVSEGFEAGGGRAETGERYQLGFVGIEAGPRARLGPLDALPYAGLGVALPLVTNENGAPPQGSTFEPSERVGLTYGVKVGVGPRRPFGLGVGLTARLGWLAGGLGDVQGADLSGPIRITTIGVSFGQTAGRRRF